MMSSDQDKIGMSGTSSAVQEEGKIAYMLDDDMHELRKACFMRVKTLPLVCTCMKEETT